MKLIVATGNAGKLVEIRRLLAESAIEVAGLAELEDVPEIVEDGETFEANARKKALVVARLTGCLTLADDSGLAVEALNGAPGVYSARYAGAEADDAANNRKLLEALQGLPQEQRKAAFHCAMALCWPDGQCRSFYGCLEGRILQEPRGDGGFGYDPLFLVPECGQSLAELPLTVKNRVSHRGQALRQVVIWLQKNRKKGHDGFG